MPGCSVDYFHINSKRISVMMQLLGSATITNILDCCAIMVPLPSQNTTFVCFIRLGGRKRCVESEKGVKEQKV